MPTKQTDKSSIRRSRELIRTLGQTDQAGGTGHRGRSGKDPGLKAKVEAVCTLKGVGLITTSSSPRPDGFALFRNKAQLVSYAGYDVGGEFSGSSIRGKSQDLQKGNSHLRRAMHSGAQR
ncbi:MAG: transposase [Saprospiraceae bacterium]